VVALASVATIFGIVLSSAEEPAGKGKKRVPWTTSKVRGSPEPPSPYRTELAFPRLKFDEPLDLNFGNGRLFVTERYGRVFTIPHHAGAKKAHLSLARPPYSGTPRRRPPAVVAGPPPPRSAKSGSVSLTVVPEGTRGDRGGAGVRGLRAGGAPPVCDPKSE